MNSFIEPERDNRNTRNNPPPPSAVSRRGGHVFASSDLTWRGDKLCLSGKALVVVVPDENYSGMWRIQTGTKLSDMVNRSRARDAARSVAVALLNGGRYSGRQGGADAIFQRKGSPGHPEAETRTSIGEPSPSDSCH
jgi:hypothetical protein